MTRGQQIDIPADPRGPFPGKGQDVGHITGTPPPEPPKGHGISVWPTR